ncbi:MAG: L-threonylcarbamoyladenylate synthase [Candidatus Aureabacteria bacterium]|nr:L-threonylcarbamoyladenylate synthase [Candidatus Auribacterota bacterium]
MVFTTILELTGGVDDMERIRQAAQALREGKVVVFPTETVYGVGCDASNADAVRRIYEIKGRPSHKPLAHYLAEREELRRYVREIPPAAERLIGRFWPGPLTLLLRGREEGSLLGFRMPDDVVALALIRAAGVPCGGTSANLSGEPNPVSGGDAVAAMRGRADIVLAGGRTRYGRESTVVDASGDTPMVVREGVITTAEILNTASGHRAGPRTRKGKS